MTTSVRRLVLSYDLYCPQSEHIFNINLQLLLWMLSMMLRIPAKVLITRGNNTFYYVTLSTGKLRHHISRVMRKPDFCLCENKGADQLCSNCTANQRLCFRYLDGTIPLPLKSEISSFKSVSETVQAYLCQTWSETPKTGHMINDVLFVCLLRG